MVGPRRSAEAFPRGPGLLDRKSRNSGARRRPTSRRGPAEATRAGEAATQDRQGEPGGRRGGPRIGAAEDLGHGGRSRIATHGG